MSLVLSNTPQNNTLASTPVFNDWGPIPNEKTFYWSPSAPATITPETITFSIKDVINNPAYNQYSEFRISNGKYYSGYHPYAWIVNKPLKLEDGVTNATVGVVPIPLVMNGIKYKYTIQLQNLNLMPVSATPYKYLIKFDIEGKKSDGTWQIITFYIYTINLLVVNNLVMSAPSSLNFVHYQGTTLPSQTLNITGTNWSVIAKPNFILSSSDIGVTISTQTDTNGDLYYVASGTGNSSVNVTLGDFYDDGIIDPAELVKSFQLKQGATLVMNIPVNITVYNQGTLNLSPTSISFYGVKGVQEPVPVHMFASSAQPPYSVATSPWLTWVIETIEIAPSVMAEVLTVVPIPTTNMAPGIYTGFVQINDIISGTPSSKMATVTYKLLGFMSSPYTPSNKAFTLDPLFFDFNTTNPDSYIQLMATFRTFNFFSNALVQNTINEKLPLFKGKGSISYGLQMHRLMQRFSGPNQNYFQYRTAEFSLYAQEVSLIDGSVIADATLPTINFVAGLSYGITSNKGFLDINQKPSRVTKNSEFYLNILIPDDNHELRVFKNGTLIEIIPLAYAYETIVMHKITFENFNQGDVIDITLNIVNDPSVNVPKKSFNVLPEGMYSRNIYWENEFLLQSCFELTGEHDLKTEFEVRSTKKFQKLVELLEYISVNKINKFSINTGWVTRNDIDTIESLMKSAKAWIELSGKTIALRPLAKTMVNEDTKRALLEYTIEFQINRNYNEETYSF